MNTAHVNANYGAYSLDKCICFTCADAGGKPNLNQANGLFILYYKVTVAKK